MAFDQSICVQQPVKQLIDLASPRLYFLFIRTSTNYWRVSVLRFCPKPGSFQKSVSGNVSECERLFLELDFKLIIFNYLLELNN